MTALWQGTRIQNRCGMVFITALAIMVILMGFGLVYLYVARTEMMISGNELRALQTFYLAEAGVEHAMAKLLYGGASYTYGIVDSVDLSDLQGGNIFSGSYKAYMPDVNTIVGQGGYGLFSREVAVKINYSGFYGAVISGRGLTLGDVMGDISGMINGNIYTTDYSPYLIGPAMTAVGSVKVDNQNTFRNSIPDANFDAYQSYVQTTDPTKYYLAPIDTGTVVYSAASPPIGSSGIYFIDGDLLLDTPNIHINGTIIVKGNLLIGSRADNLTITPAGNHPAVVAYNLKTVPLDSSSLDNVHLGMVYARDQVLIFQNTNNFTIDGALVTKNQDIQIKNATNLTINYFPTLKLDPNYFFPAESLEFLRSFPGKGIIIRDKA